MFIELGSRREGEGNWEGFWEDQIFPARALRALGLLLEDGALTVGRGKTFWRVNRFFFFYENSCNSGTESQKFVPKVEKWTVFPRATNGLLTKIGVVWQKLDVSAKNRDFGPKKTHFLLDTMF